VHVYGSGSVGSPLGSASLHSPPAVLTPPLSAADCGRHFAGGTGLLGLAAAMGAFDYDAGPDCQVEPGYAVTSGYIPPNTVSMPPDPAPLADNSPRFLVPGGAEP